VHTRRPRRTRRRRCSVLAARPLGRPQLLAQRGGTSRRLGTGHAIRNERVLARGDGDFDAARALVGEHRRRAHRSEARARSTRARARRRARRTRPPRGRRVAPHMATSTRTPDRVEPDAVVHCSTAVGSGQA
jgi:hypothetical protein